MIKIELINSQQPTDEMLGIISGMRNPMNSWDKSDSNLDVNCFGESCIKYGENDIKLMTTLAMAGTDHRKYMRMMNVYINIESPLYWWKEFDTYKIGTVANSCSTMHKIHSKEFELGDFSYEKLDKYYANRSHVAVIYGKETSVSPEVCHHLVMNAKNVLLLTVDMLNSLREEYLATKNKDIWYQMIQLLPSSYNQKRTVMLNYETLRNVYYARKHHKLDEWREFCEFVETLEFFDVCIKGE